MGTGKPRILLPKAWGFNERFPGGEWAANRVTAQACNPTAANQMEFASKEFVALSEKSVCTGLVRFLIGDSGCDSAMMIVAVSAGNSAIGTILNLLVQAG